MLAALSRTLARWRLTTSIGVNSLPLTAMVSAETLRV
jgi:hypothetical protein